MIRFFTIGLWDIIAHAGYEFVMRMDEDSFLRSPIRYNLFKWMRDNNVDYAHRMNTWEADPTRETLGRFHEFVRGFIQRGHLTERVERSGWLLEPCVEPRSVSNYSMERCGPLLAPCECARP